MNYGAVTAQVRADRAGLPTYGGQVMAADGLQAISVSSSIGLAPNNSRARPRGLRTSWATRSPISEGSADECCKRARRKGLLKGLVRSALQCKSVGEGDLRYTELVRSEARFDSEPLEVGG
jgi:hypothetical protein